MEGAQFEFDRDACFEILSFKISAFKITDFLGVSSVQIRRNRKHRKM